MEITNPTSIKKLKDLQHTYSELPWYQRFWFSLWSYRLSSALSAIDKEHPTREQVQTLLSTAKESWFFKSIFTLLDRFKDEVLLMLDVQQDDPLSQQLPVEMTHELGSDLTTKDLLKLVQSSKIHATLFQPVLDVRKLLHYVTRGEYDDVMAILKKNCSLLTTKGLITDCSGRTFSNITAFEYALWALDKHMWTKMLHCLPDDEQGQQIKISLLDQYTNLKKNGVTYRLNDKTITEKHFDFSVINALQTQLDSLKKPEPDWSRWVGSVGGAQKLFPMHVVWEYCPTRPFHPLPDFTTEPLQTKYAGEFLAKIIAPSARSQFRSSTLGTQVALCKMLSGGGMPYLYSGS